MELSTLVIYDIEDDRARTRVAEVCKDFGLERLQYSCFRGMLSANKREELLERMLRIQQEWERRWKKDFPDVVVRPVDSPVPPDEDAQGTWQPAFKIMIQPLCEKDVRTALYAYLFVDVPREDPTSTKR
jgi:sugar phosphate isomerase/epimerase